VKITFCSRLILLAWVMCVNEYKIYNQYYISIIRLGNINQIYLIDFFILF